MLLELVLFFAIASAATTAVVMIPGSVRARAWVGVPLVLVILFGAGWLTGVITGDSVGGRILPLVGLVVAGVARWRLRAWSTLAAQMLAVLTLGSATYLVYAAVQPLSDRLGALGTVTSWLLLLLESAALGLSVYYLFEILDVLSRRDRARHPLDERYLPKVAVQVPCYNEPVEVVRDTLTALSTMDYPEFVVQVVDNNTTDPKIWQPLAQLCEQLGPRFQFLHLEPWPGYKAGALNEATRRLSPDVEVLAIVDADYIVRPGFLKATVGHFRDPRVAFVQTPQHYRDWKDSGYLRGLFYSYRYFFDITMPARAHRNAIIFAGTMGLIRRSALDKIGGWNESVVTEDAEASLRLLGLGLVGVYEPTAWGEGLMPLSFDGLKKQRFRWALGGIQILRRQWRELLPFLPHRLRLTAGQRLHYLFGSVHWFSDLLTVIFTSLLLLTAAAAATHHRLPIRELTGPIVVVPLAFLTTGVLRALWALRTAEHASWGDTIRALGIWFALSWVDALAVLRGLVSQHAAFLRTPKRKERGNRLWPAVRSSLVESTLALLAVVAAIVMVITAPAIATGLLAVMLLFEAWVFGSAPWASVAAEGIQLTPARQAYLRSAQNTGDRPGRRSRAELVPAALALLVVAVLAYGLLNAPSQAPPSGQADLPTFGAITHQQLPNAGPAPTPAPTRTQTASTSPTPVATPSPTASPTASASP
jgi:Glycosyltransferase like family 2